jgi:hypothetical protein
MQGPVCGLSKSRLLAVLVVVVAVAGTALAQPEDLAAGAGSNNNVATPSAADEVPASDNQGAATSVTNNGRSGANQEDPVAPGEIC